MRRQSLYKLSGDLKASAGAQRRSDRLSDPPGAFQGSKEKGLAFCGFTDEKPVILIIGGSLGAVRVNEAVRAILPQLLERFQIIHLCGKGKMDDSLKDTKGYVQFEYIKEELRDLMAAADIMISRAGANAICEILALRKPNILIPLSAQASRGDQILNAASFEKQGYSIVIQEEELTNEKLLNAVNTAFKEKDRFIKAMQRSQLNNSIEKIVELINVSAKIKRNNDTTNSKDWRIPMNIPNDPMMLVSYLNTQLRDFYPSLEELCKSLDLDQQQICDKLKTVDYSYDAATNRFI